MLHERLEKQIRLNMLISVIVCACISVFSHYGTHFYTIRFQEIGFYLLGFIIGFTIKVFGFAILLKQLLAKKTMHIRFTETLSVFLFIWGFQKILAALVQVIIPQQLIDYQITNLFIELIGLIYLTYFIKRKTSVKYMQAAILSFIIYCTYHLITTTFIGIEI